MTGGSLQFVDTNVLLYLLSANRGKADRTEKLIASNTIVSVQVFSEFTAVARRKLGLDWVEIDEILATIREVCSVEPLTLETYDCALRLAERYGFSWYDALIAASARSAGCTTLYSEDFQHGLAIDKKLKVVNPLNPTR